MLEAYQRFFEKRQTLEPDIGCAPYGSFQLPDSLPCEWLYSQMLNEHARELANSLNEMRQYIVNLKSWSEILDDIEIGEEKHQIIFEFVSPIATLAINLPYVIRSRFFYSIAHLCHQANRFKQSPWCDDLPVDTEIYQKQADDYGVPWKKYNKLKCALEKVCNKKYQADTLDFRNKYNHRYSPRIEIGITNLVTRNVDEDKKVSYGFGGIEPLKLKYILPLLIEQYSMCMRAFALYQELVNEHISVISKDSH
jgi:hypothetical protein